MRNALAVSNMVLKLCFSSSFFIFLFLGTLLIGSVSLYFFVPELANFALRNPAQNALMAGLGSINLLLIFFGVFLSFSLFSNLFQKRNRAFLLCRGITAAEIFLGCFIALVSGLLVFFFIIAGELILLIIIFAKAYFLSLLQSLPGLIALLLLLAALNAFFFSVTANLAGAVFTFLVITASITRAEVVDLFSNTDSWLGGFLRLGLKLLPPVSELFSVSLSGLGLSPERGMAWVMLKSLFFILIFIFFGAIISQRKFKYI